MRDPLRSFSVPTKLAITFIAIVVVVLGLGGWVVSSSASRTLEREILGRVESQCLVFSTTLGTHLDTLARRCADFASDGYIREGLEQLGRSSDPARRRALQDQLLVHLEKNKLPLVTDYRDLALSDQRGAILVTVSGTIRADTAQFAARCAGSSAALFSGFHGGGDDPVTLWICCPVASLDGTASVGSILAQVDASGWVSGSLAALRRILTRHGTGVSLEIYDPTGRVLEVPPSFVHAARAARASPLVEEGFGLRLSEQARPTPSSTRREQSFAREHPVNVAPGWLVRTQVATDSSLEPVTLLRSRFLVLGICLALATTGLLYFPLRFLARPLVELTEAARAVEAGHSSVRLPVHSNDEIGQLSAAFNSMASALEERTDRLQEVARDLRQRGQELRRERDRLDTVIHSMRDALIVFDAAGEVVLHNAAARHVLAGLTGSELLKSHHPCRSQAAASCEECLAAPHESRSCVIDVGENTYEVHATSMRGSHGEGGGRVLLALEITDRIERDEQQIHQERLSVLGEVAAVMAHELNNPLTSINLFNQMTRAELPPDSPLHENVDLIERNAETCRRTVRDLLDYATGAEPELDDVDVHEVLHDVARFLRPMSRRQEIEFDWRLDAADAAVRGDEVQIRQVFVNLLMNAVQAIGERPGRVSVETRAAGEDLVVEVQDSGPGIPADQQPRIFRPFFTTKSRGGGTGLGLSTARRIAEMHGGSVELVASEPGATTFAVRLRRAPLRCELIDAGATRPRREGDVDS